MFKPKPITAVSDATTSFWKLQSKGYATPKEAKFAAVKLFVYKAGVMVKPVDGQWGIYIRGENRV